MINGTRPKILTDGSRRFTPWWGRPSAYPFDFARDRGHNSGCRCSVLPATT